MIFENAQEKQLLIEVFSKATWNNVNTMDADVILRARYMIVNAKFQEVKKTEKTENKVIDAPIEPNNGDTKK